MLKKVLAYSPDTALQETLRILVSQNPQVELFVTNSTEEFTNQLLSSGITALILDEPESEFWLSTLKFHPDLPILLIQSQEGEILVDPSSLPAHRWLQKPFTKEALLDTLRELIVVNPSQDNHELRASIEEHVSVENDLDFLQEWIATEPSLREDNLVPLTEVLSADSEIDPLTTNQTEETTPTEITSSPESINPGVSFDKQSLVNQSLSDTWEKSINTLGVAGDDLSLDAASVQVEYNCVLIPRDSQQFLTRGIAERLGLILPWILASRGWQLTGISIRPQHLHWTVALPADTSPISAIREIRHLTSEQLLSTFTELQDSDADLEFWAPGYLIVSGERSIPFSMIKAFMDRTRQLFAINT